MKKRSGFGSIHSAAGMKRYLDQKIQSEVERNKPQVRTATVVSIDRKLKKCEVRYPGEEGTVRVPYGNAEPAAVGSRVKIDGPVGSRRIVDVVGRTRTQSRIETLEHQQELAPVWSRYLETFPLQWMNSWLWKPAGHIETLAHGSPILMTRDMFISTIEIKARSAPTSASSSNYVRLALHRVESDEAGEGNWDFKFIARSERLSSNVDRKTWRYSFTLPNPHPAKRGEIYMISFATWGGDLPVIEYHHHPTIVKTLGSGQAAQFRFAKNLQGGDIPSSRMDAKLMGETIWAACFELPPNQGYVSDIHSPGG